MCEFNSCAKRSNLKLEEYINKYLYSESKLVIEKFISLIINEYNTKFGSHENIKKYDFELYNCDCFECQFNNDIWKITLKSKCMNLLLNFDNIEDLIKDNWVYLDREQNKIINFLKHEKKPKFFKTVCGDLIHKQYKSTTEYINDIIKIQPMPDSAGKVFYMNFVYNKKCICDMSTLMLKGCCCKNDKI